VDLKQAQLEQLVITYFRQREDTPVALDSGGRYEVRLNSQAAINDFGRGQSDRVMLIFDSDQSFRFPNTELITPDHPYLDIIRNSLERLEDEDPRLSNAHVPIQVVDPQGRITVPGLEFHTRAAYEVAYHVEYYPIVILTYRVLYDMDGGSENLFRICYDACSGVQLTNHLARFRPDLWLPGPPPGVDVEKCSSINTLLQAARTDIKTRVAGDLLTLGERLDRELATEKQRIAESYQREVAGLDSSLPDSDFIRQQLAGVRDREIAEWERKLSCRVRVHLLSCLRLWWPAVHYELAVQGARGAFKVGGIRYQPEIEKTIVDGDADHEAGRRLAICAVGQHYVRERDQNVDVGVCSTCGDGFCEEHGGKCANCSQPVCNTDRETCDYGEHSDADHFCPQCHTKSFEGKVLCTRCREVCANCGREFPHEKMATCRIGGERICSGHEVNPDGLVCVVCHEVSCNHHGRQTKPGDWACEDHITVSTCCREEYPSSQLNSCVHHPSERVCPTHSVRCAGCGNMICDKHRYPLQGRSGKYACENCRRSCSECGDGRSYLAKDLVTCVTGKELLCSTHRLTCAVGGEFVCQKHALKSVDGQALCSSHAGHCVQSGDGQNSPIFRIDQLTRCVVCRGNVCSDHRMVCKICGSGIMCTVHVRTQPTCQGCGRSSCSSHGCRPDSHRCARCGVSYCRHCVNSKGECQNCANLKPAQLTAEWLNYLAKAVQVGGPDARILSSMLAAPTQLTLYTARNKTYVVSVLEYQPKLWEIWKAPLRFRIVSNINGSAMRLIKETAKK
jgi:hypothetical protein